MRNMEETMVLDFADEAEEIQQALEPYYDRTLLAEGTDPNLLYDLQTRLAAFHFYSEPEVNHFATIYADPKATQDKLHVLLAPVVDRFQAANEEERVDFRGQLTDYVRLYAFLSQILIFVDADLEKLYVFSRLLLRKLPVSRDQLPVEIQQNIDMDSYRIQRTSSGKIKLERGTAALEPIGAKRNYHPLIEALEALSQILRELNERFGTEFTEEDKVFIQQLEQKLEYEVSEYEVLTPWQISESVSQRTSPASFSSTPPASIAIPVASSRRRRSKMRGSTPLCRHSRTRPGSNARRCGRCWPVPRARSARCTPTTPKR
jgi:type I restriction enzyme R subunit